MNNQPKGNNMTHAPALIDIDRATTKVDITGNYLHFSKDSIPNDTAGIRFKGNEVSIRDMFLMRLGDADHSGVVEIVRQSGSWWRRALRSVARFALRMSAS